MSVTPSVVKAVEDRLREVMETLTRNRNYKDRQSQILSKLVSDIEKGEAEQQQLESFLTNEAGWSQAQIIAARAGDRPESMASVSGSAKTIIS